LVPFSRIVHVERLGKGERVRILLPPAGESATNLTFGGESYLETAHGPSPSPRG
jgi:hypothetical protein